MKFKKMRILLVAIFMCISAANSQAALVYSVGFSGPTLVGSGPFNVSLFLQEEVSGGSTPVLGSPGFGIVFGNFLVNRTAGANIDITGVSLNPAFDNLLGGGASSFNAGSASGTQSSLGILNGIETSPGSGIYRVTLATIAMQASAVGSTTFTSADFDSILDDLVIDDGVNAIVLDSELTNNGGFGSITITSAPEPTTMGALGAFGAIGAAVGYFRRRKQKQASAKAVV